MSIQTVSEAQQTIQTYLNNVRLEQITPTEPSRFAINSFRMWLFIVIGAFRVFLLGKNMVGHLELYMAVLKLEMSRMPLFLHLLLFILLENWIYLSMTTPAINATGNSVTLTTASSSNMSFTMSGDEHSFENLEEFSNDND